MEELVEGGFKTIARILLAIVRFIIWFAWEFMCETVLWYLGWPVLKILTFGRYPKETITKESEAAPLVYLTTMLIGLTYPLIIVYFLNLYLSG